MHVGEDLGLICGRFPSVAPDSNVSSAPQHESDFHCWKDENVKVFPLHSKLFAPSKIDFLYALQTRNNHSCEMTV